MSHTFLDYNATTPPEEAVVKAVEVGLRENWGNPSSPHSLGRSAAASVAEARRNVAAMLGGAEEEVVFTSGGSEALNWAIFRGVERIPGGVVVLSAIEHPAVVETCKEAALRFGSRVEEVGVDGSGRVEVEEVGKVVRAAGKGVVSLVCVMLANNEVGTLQPVAEIVRRVKSEDENVWVLVDASQAVGKVAVDVKHLGCDFLVLAGHKFYGPKGVGALWVRKEIKPLLKPLIFGASQEGGMRAGTENVALVAGLGVAAAIAKERLETDAAHCASLIQTLVQTLEKHYKIIRREKAEGGGGGGGGGGGEGGGGEGEGGEAGGGGGSGEEKRCVYIHTPTTNTLPNTLSISFPPLPAPTLLQRLDENGLLVSAGAACHSATITPSRVLTAMGIPPEIATATLRISVGRHTTLEDIDRASKIITETVQEMSSSSSSPSPSPSTAASAPITVAEYWEGGVEGNGKVVVVLEEREGEEGGKWVERGGGKEVELVAKVEPGLVAIGVDRSVFHPQGGGQPADRGVVVIGGVECEVVDVRKGPRDSTWSEVVFLVVKVAGGGGEGVEVDVGGVVEMRVDETWRKECARMHSAGHLLDLAMKECGYTPESGFVAGRGYHFPGGCWVEYEGAVPAEERAALPSRLTDTARALAAENQPTLILHINSTAPFSTTTTPIPPSIAPLLPSLTESYPPNTPLRLVAVGREDNLCPCGGTHVKQAEELATIKVTKVKVKKGKTKVSYVVE